MSLHLAPERTQVSTIVTALFNDSASAECGWDAVTARGYRHADISAVISDETHKKLFTSQPPPPPTKDLEGAKLGGAIGSPIGALAAVLVAVGSAILIPGAGLVLAGPIIAAYAGAGASGLIIGGLIGAKVGSDVAANRVKRIEEHVKRGGFVLTVQANSSEDVDFIETAWKKWAVEVIR